MISDITFIFILTITCIFFIFFVLYTFVKLLKFFLCFLLCSTESLYIILILNLSHSRDELFLAYFLSFFGASLIVYPKNIS